MVWNLIISLNNILHNTHRASSLFGEEYYRDVRRDVTGLRIYLCGWQEIKNFACLSMKTQL